jgi:hypothetical protein
LTDLEPCKPIVRYEHERPGDLIHIDTKKLVRIAGTVPRSPWFRTTTGIAHIRASRASRLLRA